MIVYGDVVVSFNYNVDDERVTDEKRSNYTYC